MESDLPWTKEKLREQQLIEFENWAVIANDISDKIQI